ncbi:MAG: leucine--tRNA ligase [Candidatus Norongarragalinales archaeon]
MVELDFKAIEAKWQARWLQARAFEPEPSDELAGESDAEKNKFFFTVPYPYVSGVLHVGHGRTYANGDVIARFQRMKGKNVLWPMAFHITGTPVLAVSAKIAAGDAETLAMYEDYVRCYENDEARVKEIVASFVKPEAVVAYFSKKIVLDFQRMGFSLDYLRQFTTGDPEYNRFIEWQFSKYKERGYLKQASYPVLYCVRCANAVGEDDIKDGDTDAVSILKFVAVKFELRSGDENDGAFVVSCTLRPETVFGITNEFVNPSEEYVKARVDGETWFVSAAAVEKLKLQGHVVEVVGKQSGDYFVGKTVVTPLGARVPILPAEFVDVNTASGFVHSVPSHAPWDWQVLEDLRKDKETLTRYADRGLEKLLAEIKPISLISVDGFGEHPAQEILRRMKVANCKEKAKIEKATNELYKAEFYGGRMKQSAGEFAGLSVTQAKDKVAEKLIREKKAVWFYETNRNAECRCGGNVRVAVLGDQWFLDFNAPGWKEKARECLDAMTIYPPAYRKQFQDVFDWLDKRPCARRRGLGTRLPFAPEWIIESLSDSTIYMAFYAAIKRIRAAGLQSTQLTPEFFDYVFLGKGNAAAIAADIKAEPDALKSIRSEFLYWYPNDLRHTAVAHVANHLSFFIFAHAACFERRHWPRGVSLNEMVVCEGAKMSKSKGNVVLLNDVARDYGADLFRVYAVGAADFASTLDFRKRDIEAARRSLARFFEIAVKLIDAAGGSGSKSESKSALTTVALSRFESAVLDATRALDELRLRDYVQTAFYKQLNNFEDFLRRATQNEIAFVARECAARWIALLSPVIPHACEELWERAQRAGLAPRGFVSLAKWPEAREALIDARAEASEELVANVVADCRKIAGLLKKPKIDKLVIITASAAKRVEAKRLVAACAAAEEVKASDEALEAFLRKRFYELKEKPAMLEVDDYEVLSAAREFIGKTLSCEVVVEREEESASERAARAMPGKPAVLIE